MEMRQTKHFDYPLTPAIFCHGKLILVKGLTFASFSLQSSSCQIKKTRSHQLGLTCDGL